MVDFTVEVRDAELRTALRGLLARVRDARPALEDIARALRNSAEDAFENQRSPFGEPWADLQESTTERRAKQGHWPGSILQVSGGLAASLDGGAGADRAWVGAGKVYAAAHQFGMPKGYAGTTRRGGPIPWGDVPARPYLPIDASCALPGPVREEILAILREYLAP